MGQKSKNFAENGWFWPFFFWLGASGGRQSLQLGGGKCPPCPLDAATDNEGYFFRDTDPWRDACFNPCLPKVFSVTHLPKGGGYHPLMNLRLICPNYKCVVPWYRGGLLFPVIQKIWKSANVWRHNDVFKHGRPEKADFQWNIGQNCIFAKKSSKYRNFTRFFAYKGGKWCFNMFCKFQDSTMKIFFKMAT